MTARKKGEGFAPAGKAPGRSWCDECANFIPGCVATCGSGHAMGFRAPRQHDYSLDGWGHHRPACPDRRARG